MKLLLSHSSHLMLRRVSIYSAMTRSLRLGPLPKKLRQQFNCLASHVKCNVLGDCRSMYCHLHSCACELQNDPRGFCAKVSDFGLSRLLPDHSPKFGSNPEYTGTITHMAPELLEHGGMSRAADVYSYGILSKAPCLHCFVQRCAVASTVSAILLYT